MKRTVLAIALAVMSLAYPASALAQIIITPFGGATFGGDANDKALSLGGSITFMGKVAGVELEVGYTPDFFGEQHGVALISDSNVSSVMANLVIGPNVGPFRPYIVGGIGLLRSRQEAPLFFTHVTANAFGLDAGVGVLVVLTDHIGLRGDARYFTRLTDPSADNDLDVSLSGFHFWRGTAGLSFRF